MLKWGVIRQFDGFGLCEGADLYHKYRYGETNFD
jgi:hypothetical protein